MSNLIDDVLANPIVGAVGTALAVAGVALWLAAAWWASRDAARRTGSTAISYGAAAWVLLSTPLLLPFSLAIYAVLRPPTTAAEDRAQSLIAALSADTAADSSCPGCAGFVDHAWLRCPSCATWLAAPCSSCGEWSPADLDLCPFCGREGHAAPAVDSTVPGIAAAADGEAGDEHTDGVAAATVVRAGAAGRPVAARGVVARLGVPVPRRSGA